MLGPAGKPTEPPSSPNNPLRKFTGKVAQMASQLSSKSVPKLRSSSSRYLNNNTNTNAATERVSSGSARVGSKTSSPALSTSSSYIGTGSILYYDSTCPRDNQVYDNRKLKSIDRDITKVKYPSLYGNLSLLLEQFQQVRVLNSFQSLASQLFSYKEISFTTLIYVENADDDDKETVKFISSQFSHIPGLFIVLSDVNNLWPSYSRLGAIDVAGSLISTDKLNYWTNLVSTHRREQIESRTTQLKTILGLSEESPNIMTRFSVPNLTNFTPSLESLINHDRLLIMKQLIGTWDFYAHDLKYDELLIATYLMIRHALNHEEIKEYDIPDNQLISLLFVVRNCYHATNPYHNFRHAVDVVQATFFFLITIGVFRKVDKDSFKDISLGGSTSSDSVSTGSSANINTANTTNNIGSGPSKHLRAIDGLSILVAALGHDVGHPGVTNAFLVSSNAPLAKIYNDRSVLESYHSAAFNQILKKYWPQMIKDINARTLITESVLATDMAVHFEYMKKAEIKGKEPISPNPTTPEEIKQVRILLACLILKCADISNVSRKLDISSKWGTLLIEEFGGLNELEIDLGLKQPSPPAAVTPVNSEPVSAEYRIKLLGEGQIFFIETYALPLFSAVSKMIPEMKFASRQIEENVQTWKSLVKDDGN